MLALLIVAAFYAGVQNTLAGGGSFITFPALLLAGLNPVSANITSTVALFPSQITASYGGRQYVGGTGNLSFKQLVVISLVGGVIGALLLALTPSDFFAKLVPWLVLFATAVYTWGSFFRKPSQTRTIEHMSAGKLGFIQFLISVYGGYFGGGIGLLMLAALTVAGQAVRTAGATKNALAMVMNGAAVVVFAFSGKINWHDALVVGIAAIFGGYCGAWLLTRLPEKLLRGFVVVVGIVLTVWLFMRR